LIVNYFGIKEREFVRCGRVKEKSWKNKTDLDTELNIENKTVAVSMAFFFYHGATAQWAKASSLSKVYDRTQTHHTW
jgi:hypothetical protein